MGGREGERAGAENRRKGVIPAAAIALGILVAGGWALWRGGVVDRLMPGPPPLAYLCRQGPDCRVTMLVRLASAPFPFTPDPAKDEPAPAGRYTDDRVLIHVPPGFDPARPFRILLFFHGNGATLSDTVVHDEAIPAQVNASGRNVILVAPQLAYDARDSHPGKLLRPGGVRRLLAAALGRAADALGVSVASLAGGPVIVAAYSGGWWPAMESVTKGELDGRLRTLVLLDAFYGGEAAFADWAGRARKTGALVALYSKSSAAGAETFLEKLSTAGIATQSDLPAALPNGTVAVVSVDTPHRQVPMEGPPDRPLAEILRRLPPFDDAVTDPAARLPGKP
jgi:hypothetical protein